jgi:hypothetical protein
MVGRDVPYRACLLVLILDVYEEITYELEFTEMSEVENWDGTFRGIGLGFR